MINEQSRFLALMSDFNRTMELTEIAYDSAGKSALQFSKYQDTLEYQVNKLSNTWEQFRINLVGNKLAKNLVSGLDKVLSAFNGVNFIELLLGGAAAVIFGQKFLLNVVKGIQNGVGAVVQAGQFIGQRFWDSLTNDNGRLKQLAQKIPIVYKQIQKYQDLISRNDQAQMAKSTLGATTVGSFQKQDGSSLVYSELNQALRGVTYEAANTDRILHILQNTLGMNAVEANALTRELQNNSSGIRAGMTRFSELGRAAAEAETRLQSMRNTTSLLKNTFAGLAQGGVMALIAGLTTGDAKAGLTALSTTMIMQLTQVGTIIQSIASTTSGMMQAGRTFGGALIGALASGNGIMLAITAAIAISGFLINRLMKANAENAILNQSFLKQQEILEKNKELLENQVKSQKSKADEEKKSLKSSEELKEAYEKLNKNISRTSEEQEKYSELVDQIISEFPEVIKSYNEITGELTVQNDLWSEILEKMSIASKKEKFKSLNYENYLEETEKELQKRGSVYKETEFADSTSVAYNELTNLERNLGQGDSSEEIIKKFGKSQKGYERNIRDLALSMGLDLKQSRDADTLVAFLNDNKVVAAKTLGALDELSKMGQMVGTNEGNLSEQFIAEKLLPKNFPDLVDFFSKANINLDSETLLNLGQENYELIYQKTLEYFENQYKVMSIEETRNKEIFEAKKKAIASEAIQTQTGTTKTVADIISPVAQKQISRELYDEFYRLNSIDTILGKDGKKITTESMGETARGLLTEYSDEQIKIKGSKKKGREELQVAYEEALKKYYEPELIAFLGEKVISDLSKVQIDFLNSLSKLSEGTTTLEQSTDIFENIRKTLGDKEDVKSAANEYGLAYIDEFYAILDGAGKKAGILSYLPKLSSEDFKTYSKQTILQLKEAIESERVFGDRNEFASKLFGLKESTGLTNDAFGFISQIAANDLSLIDIYSKKDDVIKNLREIDTTLSSSKAEEVWGGVVDIFKDFYDLSLATSLELENLDVYIQSSREKAKTLWDTMSDALSKQGKNGALPLEQYNKLIKNGMEQYIEETADGFKISTEGLIKELTMREQVLVKLKEAGAAREIGIQKQLESVVLTKEERAELIEKLRLLREANSELQTYIETQEAYSITQILEMATALKDTSEDLSKATDKANKSYQDSIKKIDDLNKKLIESEDALTAAMYGTDKFKKGLDRLLNSSERIKTLERQLSNLNKAFEDSDGSNLVELGQRIKENYENQSNVITATIEANKKALEETDNQLKDNFGNYVTYYGDTMAVNYDYAKMQDSDEIKKTFEELIKLRGELSDAIYNENEQLEKNQEAWKNLGKELRDNYITVQEKILELLKKNANEELEVSKNKYKALEEQENKYLENLTKSIEKQRQLRERQRSFEQLAEKEGRLALMQRDTSGSNVVSQRELQKDISSTKENMMDKEIDTLVSNMKEMYQTQKEARELEIQYIENMIETTDWMSKVNDVMNTITSKEDLIGWFMDYDSSIKEMSVEQVEKYVEEITTHYDNTQKYLALAAAKGTEDIRANMDEVFKIISELGIDTEMARQAVEAGIAIKEETIQKAQEALEDAKKNLLEAQTQSEEYKLAWIEAQEAAAKAGINSAKIVAQALEELSKKAEEFSIRNAIYAVNAMAKLNGVDLTNDSQVQDFANKNNLVKEGKYVDGLGGAIAAAKGQPFTPTVEKKITYSLKAIPRFPGMPQQVIKQDFKDEEEAKKREEYYKSRGYSTSIKQYKKGGKVDYTGLAWVDGTKEQPEAFLNSKDVKNIENLTQAISKPGLFNSQKFNDLLSRNPFESFKTVSKYSPAVADEKVINSKIENHINIEVKEMKNDYDVEQMLNVIEKRIYEATKPIGGNVFLK